MDAEHSCEAARILYAAAAALGKEPAAVTSIVVRIVEGNWIETAAGLRSLTTDDWQRLQVPIALQKAVHNILNSVPESYSRQPANSHPVADAAAPPAAPPAASYSPRGAAADSSQFRLACDQLEMELRKLQNNNKSLSICLHSCYKIVNNVLIAPSDPQKRRIRLSTLREKCGSAFEAVLVFLQAVGFQLTEENSIHLQTANIATLRDAKSALGVMAGYLGVKLLADNYRFQPFKTSVVSTGTNSTSRVLHDASLRKACGIPEVLPHAALQEAKTLLETKLSRDEENAYIDRISPLVYHPAVGARFREDTTSTARTDNPADKSILTLDEAFSADESEDLNLTVSELAQLKDKLLHGPQFQNRSINEVQQYEALRVTDGSVAVRIVLPDKWEVRFDAPARADVRLLYEVVRNVLRPELSATNFELYTTPPITVLKAGASLVKMRLIPAAKLWLRLPPNVGALKTELERGSSFLRQDLVTPDMCPPPEPAFGRPDRSLLRGSSAAAARRQIR